MSALPFRLFSRVRARHLRAYWLLLALLLALGHGAARANDAGAADAGAHPAALGERPGLGDMEARARLLFDAVRSDDPERAKSAFFPREAFLQVKAMANPGRYYDRLYARFAADIHALHKALPDLAEAEFDHLELVRRGGYVKPAEEGNRLGYWASRHSFLVYRVGKQLRRFEVRVLITWQERWYVIHLSDF